VVSAELWEQNVTQANIKSEQLVQNIIDATENSETCVILYGIFCFKWLVHHETMRFRLLALLPIWNVPYSISALRLGVFVGFINSCRQILGYSTSPPI